MSQFQAIEATALLGLLTQQEVLLVDVRNEDEVRRGRIANAIHIPLAKLAEQYQQLAHAQHVVFYCHSGVRSAMAAEFAASQGTAHAYNLTGGVIAWAKAGYDFVNQ